MVWNAERVREVSPQNLAVRFELAPDEGGPIGNFGVGDIVAYIRFALVTYYEEAAPLVKRGIERIDQGLASKEYEWFGAIPAQHQYNLHEARALGGWLQNGWLEVQHWNEARRFFEAWWRSEKRPWTRQEIIRDGLDDYMVMAVLGGEVEDRKYGLDPFRAGVDMYEHWMERSDISLKKTLKPRELGYALCRHYLGGEFDREELLQAGRKMLASKLESDWLQSGQYIPAATWLMAIYWYPSFHYGEALPSPVETLLKAYDDMPNVKRPF